MCDCCQNQSYQDESSSFIFGIIFGLIITTIVAVIIYRQDKGKTFEMLGKKLEEIFKKFSAECSRSKPSPKSKLIAKKSIKNKIIL